MTIIFTVIIVFLFLLAIFDLIVGVSNDAVNFLNSAIGAKSAPFKVIIAVAALGVFCGAAMSNGMMEIARHGIFRPEYYSFNELMIIFFSVMITDVVLLDMFNSLGMPTSTTVSLVFELLGASFFMAMSKVNSTLGFQDLLNTEKALQVILAIFLSVAIAFFFGSLVQYLSRLLFTFNYKKNLKWFAGIFGGLAVTSIIYFMLIKGVKDAAFMTGETKDWVHANASKIVLCCLAGFTVLMQLLHWMRVNVFKVVILLGTFALALAFAGNDLVNFIGVPLAGLASYQDYMANGNGAYDTYLMGALNEPATTPTIFLVAAGAVMVYALVTSKKAHNVIKTSVDLSRQEEGEELFGSSAIARSIVRFSTTTANAISGAVPRSVSRWVDSRFNKDELILANGAAFDLVRASVNVVLAGLLIALGTSLKLPLSTTYVAFMVAMGSSLADRAWSRESAVFRITGVFSVIGGWFITAGAAFILGFVVTMVNYFGGIVAMAGMVALAVFLLIRSNIHYNKKKKSEKKDAIFIEMMSSHDKEEVWHLLTRHIRTKELDLLDFAEENYMQMTEGFINEDIKKLRRSIIDQNAARQMLKVNRRKETLGIRRVDEARSAVKNTWFHLGSNSCEQIVFCLKRIAEPCKEHVDNNFNPLPKECVAEFLAAREKLILYINEAKLIVANESEKAPEPMTYRGKDIKKELKQLRKTQLARIQAGTSSLKISLVYLNLLQESQQLVNILDDLIHATEKLFDPAVQIGPDEEIYG